MRVLGVFIIGVGLFYGAPGAVLENAFDIAVDDNALHIFRAIMGLYCGVGLVVFLGAYKHQLTRCSLLLATVFFGGVGLGRMASFVIDGNFTSVAAGAMAFELLLFAICIMVLRQYSKASAVD